ncbi:MAG: hypothetical protein JO273_02190 [Methylobacteriaceae bacterium]|nr:hypothetical protein [Methylobacteriaceae bacterium]
MNPKIIALLLAAVASWSGRARAEEILVRDMQYSNDRTTKSGRTASCIVTGSAARGQAAEMIGVQLLAFAGLLGWKAIAMRSEPGASAAASGTVADVHFREAPGIGRRNVHKANTPKGDLMAYLIDMGYAKPLLGSFFHGSYTLDVVWKSGSEARSYRVAAPPPKDVYEKFRACVDSLTRP